MRRNRLALLVLALITCSVVLALPALAQSGTGLTRGNQFSITITGKPNTPYYIWDAHTFSMSGEAGDQPPVIINYQQNIVKDPDGGPYVIGNYQYSGGGGRTIREDVAPSSGTMSNTNYYAEVTTDSTGVAIVGFQTSSNTATRTFSIEVENPNNPNDATFSVQRGTLTTRPGSVSIGSIMEKTTVPTTPPTPVPTTVQATMVTETSTPVPIPTETPTPAATPMPVELVVIIGALGFGICLARKQ